MDFRGCIKDKEITIRQRCLKDLHYDVRDLDELSKRLAVIKTWFAGRNVRWYELRFYPMRICGGKSQSLLLNL